MAVLLGVFSPAVSAASAETAAEQTSLAMTGVPAPQNNAGAGVFFLDENGTQASCDTYTEIGSGMFTWGVKGESTWYVAGSTQELAERVTVNGDVHLILVDGVTLTVRGGIRVASGSSLTIYAQSTEGLMGALVANASSEGNAGIGGNAMESNGAITINGGKITATGADASGNRGGGSGIGGGEGVKVKGTITINGGNITAIGGTGDYGAGAGIGGGGISSYVEKIVITGGVIYAEAGANGAAGIGGGGHDGILETIVITGGIITAKGTYRNGIPGNGHANAIGGGGGKNAADPSDFNDCIITDVQAQKTSIYGDKSNDGYAVLSENYIIADGETLEITEGTILVIERGVTLTNNGTFIHNGGLENYGMITGDGTVIHHLSSGTAIDANEHRGACGCGEPMQGAHIFGNYRDNEDGTHTGYCSICQYEKDTSHTYNTQIISDAFVQSCSLCGMKRTITVSSVIGELQFDTSGPDIKVGLTLQAEASTDVQEMSWQWQKMETKTAFSIAPSKENDEGYRLSYTYQDVPEGGTIAFRYLASAACHFDYYLSGPDQSREYVNVDKAMSDYETVVFAELPAGTYTLHIYMPYEDNVLTLDMQAAQVSYGVYTDISGAAKASYTEMAFESGAQYRVQIFLENQTLVREYLCPERLTISGVEAQVAQYDGSAHTGYTGTAVVEGYNGYIEVTYQIKNGETYRDIASAPVEPGQYRVLFTTVSEDGALYGIEALEFAITGQDTSSDNPGEGDNGGTNSGESAVQTGDESNLFFWTVLLCTSAACLAGAGFVYKRGRK